MSMHEVSLCVDDAGVVKSHRVISDVAALVVEPAHVVFVLAEEENIIKGT